VLASVGQAQVLVYQRPRVAIRLQAMKLPALVILIPVAKPSIAPTRWPEGLDVVVAIVVRCCPDNRAVIVRGSPVASVPTCLTSGGVSVGNLTTCGSAWTRWDLRALLTMALRPGVQRRLYGRQVPCFLCLGTGGAMITLSSLYARHY
jgi:hypothetical protein